MSGRNLLSKSPGSDGGALDTPPSLGRSRSSSFGADPPPPRRSTGREAASRGRVPRGQADLPRSVAAPSSQEGRGTERSGKVIANAHAIAAHAAPASFGGHTAYFFYVTIACRPCSWRGAILVVPYPAASSDTLYSCESGGCCTQGRP